MRRMKTETITGRDEAGGQIIVQNYCCLLTAWKHKHINKFPNMHTNTQTEAHTWPTVVLLHPDITVALSHAGLGVQEREAHGPLRTQTGIVAPTVFNGFLIKLLTEAERRGEGRRRSKEKENQPSISRETSGQVHEDMFHSLSLSSHADLVLVTGPSRWSALAVHAQHHLTFTVRPWLTFSVRFLCFCLVLHLPVLDDCTSRLPAGKKEEKTNRCGESLLHPTLALLCLLIVSLFSASLFSLNWVFFSFWNHFWQRLCIHSLFSLLFLTFYGGPLSVSLLSADIKVTQLSRPSTFKCRAEPAAAPAADFRFYCADMEERKDYLWSEELMRRFYLQSESFCNLLDKRASEQSAMSPQHWLFNKEL